MFCCNTFAICVDSICVLSICMYFRCARCDFTERNRFRWCSDSLESIHATFSIDLACWHLICSTSYLLCICVSILVYGDTLCTKLTCVWTKVTIAIVDLILLLLCINLFSCLAYLCLLSMNTACCCIRLTLWPSSISFKLRESIVQKTDLGLHFVDATQ